MQGILIPDKAPHHGRITDCESFLRGEATGTFYEPPLLFECDAHTTEETFIESKLFEQQRVIPTVMRI